MLVHRGLRIVPARLRSEVLDFGMGRSDISGWVSEAMPVTVGSITDYWPTEGREWAAFAAFRFCLRRL
jgi:hypothetical protein